MEIGAGTLSAEVDGRQWSGAFRAAHAWTGEADLSKAHTAGTGSATWLGIAEAARTADFACLPGTAELRIEDLSRPLVDVDVDVGVDLDDGGGGVALRWTGMEPAAGASGRCGAGTDCIDSRSHGPCRLPLSGVPATTQRPRCAAATACEGLGRR